MKKNYIIKPYSRLCTVRGQQRYHAHRKSQKNVTLTFDRCPWNSTGF